MSVWPCRVDWPCVVRRLAAVMLGLAALTSPAQALDGCVMYPNTSVAPSVVGLQDVIGTYRRLPVENGFHAGSLALKPGSANTLTWTNAAGVSWTLTPDLANRRLLTAEDNPYQNSGGVNFTLEFQNGELAGFRFNGELYQLDSAYADRFDAATGQLTINRITVSDRSYCRVVVTLGQLISVGQAPPQGETRFDPATGRLKVPAVKAFGSMYYNVEVALGSVLSYNVLPSYSGSTYHGYANLSALEVPPAYRYGISLYTSIQQVADVQVRGLQFGWGTWLMPDNRSTTFSLCPPGTLMQQIAPTRWWDVFQTIEGGAGQWVSTRFPSSLSKWRANSTPDCYNNEMSTPGYGFTGNVAGPDALGLAQLSNRVVLPPDGWTFNLDGQASGLFGYGYLALPVIPANGLTGVQAVGNQNWVLLVNSSNFKGPVAFYTARSYTSINALDARIAGHGMDAMPAFAPSLALEINTVPGFTAVDSNGVTYRRVARVAFPVTDAANRRATLTQDFTSYSRQALWDGFSSALLGGSLPLQLDGAGAHAVSFTPTGLGAEMADMNEPVQANGFVTSAVSTNAGGGTVFSLQWDDAKNAGALPEYFRRDPGGWTPIDASRVPASTHLAIQNFPALSATSWPALDASATSAWTSTRWAAGPFTTRLNDGSTVTYVWYRFVDQPAISRLGLDAATRQSVQALVERMHAQYGANGPSMAPPSAGKLVSIDAGMLVTPPPGLSIGYIPIAIGQR